MSSPFVYTPSTSSYRDLGPSPYLAQFNNRQRVSPYIPTVNLNDPSAPNTPIRGSKILDEDPWNPPYTRNRRPSWHAGMSAPVLSGPALVAPSLSVPADYHHTRRRSLDNRSLQLSVSDYYQQPNPYPWMVPGVPPAPASGPPYGYAGYPPVVPSELHPILRPDSHAIYFDLSHFEFRPVDAKGNPLPVHLLAEPATHPPTTRLVIKTDQNPNWPIVLDYYAATLGAPYPPATLPPITLGDVLLAIHQSMQTQLTHKEWAELDEREEIAVGKAYVRRYKLVPGYETHIASEGVRRVDYLLKKVMFAGLTRRSGDQGYENLKLHVKSK